MTTTKQIKRASTTVKGNLVRALEPGLITLCKTPANQRAFSIVRSAAAGSKGESGKTTPSARRVSRRADTATHMPLIQFPEGYTVEQAQAKVTEYGLLSYEVLDNDGRVQAQRTDLQSAANPEALVPIMLTEDGITAYVKRSESGGEATAGKNKIAVVAFEFDTSVLSEEQISVFIQRNAVDKAVSDLDNSGDTVSVLRHSEQTEGEEVRRVQIEDGVIAVIQRSYEEDIPAGFVQVINENAFGQWGWGQLDFFAILADRYVSSQLEDGLYTMRDVLNRILFYSDLPIEVKKALVSRTLAQYDAYVSELLDMLPRQMLIAVAQVDDVQRSTAEPSIPQQENAMSGTAATPTPNAAAPVAQGISRSDVAEMIEQNNTKLLAGIGDAVATAIQRNTDAAKAAEATAKAEAEAAEAQAKTQTEAIQRAVAEAVEPLKKELDAVKGTTVLRTTPEGQETPAAKPSGEQVKRSANDVFRGAIFRSTTTPTAAQQADAQ